MNALDRPEIDKLFARVAEGDRSAVDAAFEALAPIVKRYCIKVLSHAPEADDATQASLIKMFERAPSYDPNRSAVGFALAIAFWECRSARKTAARERKRTAPYSGEVSATAQDPEARLSDAERAQIARDLIDALPWEDRTLLMDDSGTSARELADHLADLSAPTLRKRKQRVLKKLRESFVQIISPPRPVLITRRPQDNSAHPEEEE